MDAARNPSEWASDIGAVPETSSTMLLTLQQLQTAVAGISRALNAVLRDDSDEAVDHLRRAENSLRARLQPLSSNANTGPRLVAWQVKKVKEHVEMKLATPIRNGDLAALVNLSEFHFSVAFRNSVGDSPHEYIIRSRIARAQQLMLSTDKPLCDVAIECGLADQAHLSRLFRRVVGSTPASWRRARASDAGFVSNRSKISGR